MDQYNRQPKQSTPGVPPHDLEAEKSVIGALLLDKDAIVKVVEYLRPKHFYKTAHTFIYDAILNLYEKREPADLITVPAELKRQNRLEEVGGVTYLSELATAIPTSANIEYYAQMIRDDSLKRGVLSAAAEIGELVHREPNIDNILDTSEQLLFSIYRDRLHQDFVHVK
ncbi:MAG TPA: DnaB-like helicase N-terminal domain-containing protein, partial [Candidatus Saccharimonadales bacterium]|nr:DnaB-like helicase N-terminal domain-containing protein [Candidatus Saccharimonadales bacterium]